MSPSRFTSEAAFSHVDSWFLSGISYFYLCIELFLYWCACAIHVRVWQAQFCYNVHVGVKEQPLTLDLCQCMVSKGWKWSITKFAWRAFLPPEPSHRWCVGFEMRVSGSLGWATTHHVAEEDFVLLSLSPHPAECWDCRHASPCWAGIFQS